MAHPEHAPTLALLHEQHLVRTAVARELRDMAPYQLAAEVEDAAGFKRAFALGPPPTAVLLSIEAALADECAMLRWLMKYMPTVRNVLLGAELPVGTMVRVLRAGAHGFGCTRTKLDQLRKVLDSVCAGALAFPACLEAYLRDHLPEPQEHTERAPTKRERQVLILLGRSDHPTLVTIAKELGISLGRVKTIRAKLCKVYKVNGRGGLVLLGMRLGLVKA
jgi:DNA-binding NarL/FixJ family response regulator